MNELVSGNKKGKFKMFQEVSPGEIEKKRFVGRRGKDGGKGGRNKASKGYYYYYC